MLSFNQYSDFLQRKKTQLQEVEDQTEILQNNIMENKCELWLDPILTRILLAYGLLEREFAAFRIERKDKSLLRPEDFISTITISNKVMREYGPLIGIATSGRDFPSTDEQAEILCHAFQNWQKVETLFKEKGYRVDVKTYGNRDRDLIVYLEE